MKSLVQSQVCFLSHQVRASAAAAAAAVKMEMASTFCDRRAAALYCYLTSSRTAAVVYTEPATIDIVAE